MHVSFQYFLKSKVLFACELSRIYCGMWTYCISCFWQHKTEKWWIRSREGVSKWAKGCARETEREGDRKKYAQTMMWKEWEGKWVKRDRGREERETVRERKGVETWRERCKESRDREREREKERERPLVSSFLLVIGFSDWSKLFFSILLVSLSPAPFFPLRGVKDKADGPNCVAGPCSQQWPFEANFPAHGAEKDGERRVERDGGTLRRVEGWRDEGVLGEGGGWHWEVLGVWIRVSVEVLMWENAQAQRDY